MNYIRKNITYSSKTGVHSIRQSIMENLLQSENKGDQKAAKIRKKNKIN